jgi:mercuric ion transport protein
MVNRNLLRAGIAGTALAALCCFTPALALLFGALGLSAWLVWADLVLLPVLIASVALVAYALYAARRA